LLIIYIDNCEDDGDVKGAAHLTLTLYCSGILLEVMPVIVIGDVVPLDVNEFEPFIAVAIY
jgi:hypothetical protein